MLKNLILGHLGKDAVVSNVNGKTVINFNVAHSENWTDNAGVKNQKTTWVGCSYWTEKNSHSAIPEKRHPSFYRGKCRLQNLPKRKRRNIGTAYMQGIKHSVSGWQ